MNIDLGQISFDEDVVLKQLRQDFRDDWFPDPLGFSDFIEAGLVAQVIENNFKENHGSYIPSRALLLNVPKGNFTLRYALETSVADRTVYQALASALLPLFDKTISWRVFSHRHADSVKKSEGKRSPERYSFRNPIAAWNDFIGCVQSSMHPGAVLLSTDLANYFENISLNVLRDEMLALVPKLETDSKGKASARTSINQLFTYLSSWTYSTERGLPQNRDASSFLANLYMRSVDCAMVENGYNYFRYMDDIKIVCDDVNSARMALKALILNLRPIGQVVNSGKTKIVSASDEQQVKECLASGSPELRKINASWLSKSLKQLTRSFLPLKALALKTLEERRYESREFRYCIARLEALARCSDFSVPNGYFEDITPRVLEGLDEAPVATDQICKYLRSVPLLDAQHEVLVSHLADPGRSIYNWKNYQLWILLAQKGYRSQVALDLARKIVELRPDDPTRAGATIYLGALGTGADREFIARNFKSLDSFIGQRSAIIAVQELHYRPGRGGAVSVETHVQEYLRRDLRGSYRALGRKGVYVAPLEPVSISRYVEWERDYD